MSPYGNLCLASIVSRVSCSFVMNVLRLGMDPSCMDVGQLASHYGYECAMCTCGNYSSRVPSLASVSAFSFQMMPMCARTLCMCIMYGVKCICRTMAAISSLSR